MTIASRQHKMRLVNIIAVVTLVMFSFLALVSINSAVHMTMDDGMMMANCPFMIYQDTICQMTVAEHIEHWQKVVAGIIPHMGLFGAFFVIFFVLRSRFILASRQKWRHILRLKYNFRPLWRVYLHAAFSDGILHPKRYNLITA